MVDPGVIRVSLPITIAKDLVDQGVVEAAIDVRSASDILQVGIDVANTGAAVVAVGQGYAVVRKFTRALVARLRGKEDKIATLTLGRGGRKVEIPLGDDLEASADEIAEVLIREFGRKPVR